ncbi:protein disulfide isomerase family protein [Clavispora lusitaniae]|uniref:protein disulfide-isomerase n=2 Tax=Clavispora lusitaniae TaxID=36911 RepID=C4Y795_CLAL4|nr:uncharacterized protein CLUG_04029 [Clavispora lusitaniae ATCC 42720]EEQ39901.1 hypothetical protein CLUG_04029 [Clavispora lusitaniae ATCC 42720]KAF7582139.1 protein disulfide isomerase family protein [Clavispora lusitaniae]OVF10687.1 putative protein disulfide isomerase [Clavispora lusitaniae]
MQFWKFSSQVLATVLATVSVVAASGPSDGDAIADPNSAVVKLTAKEFKSFLDENPLVLTEFFAPWCGYCKQLGPELSKAADILNETHPKIKVAQVDCTEEETLCQQHQIRGYPTLKVMRGAYNQPSDYNGPRSADGIVEYMIQQSLPPVQQVSDVEEIVKLSKSETKPFMIQVFPSAVHKSAVAQNETFNDLASSQRSEMTFVSVETDAEIKKLNKLLDADISTKSASYLIVHPNELSDARVFSGEFSKENIDDWVKNAKVPYFGDINRDTYLVYMASTLPLGYYFYNDEAQRKEVDEFFSKLGKKYSGKMNFVGLDASQFGRHAEILNMDPEIVPLFAVQNNSNGKKYGINQTEYPSGPSTEVISDFVEKFLAGEVEPIVKSEPLPTEEEVNAQAVVKLVAHNYMDVLNDTSKDVFIKYYAPWCGHCKKLAPIWEELAEIYGSKDEDSKVVIANVDHTLNDVDTPIMIEGYPTLIFYPANGKVNEATGLREHVIFENARDLETLMEFIKKHGVNDVDGEKLKAAREAALQEAEDAEEDVEEEESAADHDEL